VIILDGGGMWNDSPAWDRTDVLTAVLDRRIRGAAVTAKLHPEARHHARRAMNYLAEVYDLDDVYLDLGPQTVVVLRLNSPDHVGVRIRLEIDYYHLEASHESGPWLPVLHLLSQDHLARLIDAVSAVD